MSCELIQEMDDELDCLEVIFQNYITMRSDTNIFCFFEGKDDYKYYCCRINQYCRVGDKHEHYICNNKDNVLKIYDMIKKQTAEKKDEIKMYFVDRDYDKSKIKNNDIYVTPTYAIENFYISDAAIHNILVGEWGLSADRDENDEKDLRKAIKLITEGRDSVVESMLYANAWYSLQKNKRNDTGNYPDLKSLKEYSKIKDVTSIADLEKLTPDYVKVSEEEIQKEISWLKCNSIGRIRGKYFEQTMPKVFTKVFMDSNKKKNREYFNKRHKVNLNIGEDNMVSVLSQYADTPDCLKEYLFSKFRKSAYFRELAS